MEVVGLEYCCILLTGNLQYQDLGPVTVGGNHSNYIISITHMTYTQPKIFHI